MKWTRAEAQLVRVYTLMQCLIFAMFVSSSFGWSGFTNHRSRESYQKYTCLSTARMLHSARGESGFFRRLPSEKSSFRCRGNEDASTQRNSGKTLAKSHNTNVSGSGEISLQHSLDKEFVKIAVPAFVQFAAEPIAGLINTVYLGQLGALALGSAGVAISAQYSVSKLYNDPLLRTSISLVAAASPPTCNRSSPANFDTPDFSRSAQLSRAVSSALLLAGLIGLVQGAVYGVCSDSIISSMGVSASSPMFNPAVSYLRVRGIGAPGSTLWLVANGIYRGLGDTATPLRWALAFAAINAALDPFFIFALGLGCPGAAIGTVVAQYIALSPLLIQVVRLLDSGAQRNEVTRRNQG